MTHAKLAEHVVDQVVEVIPRSNVGEERSVSPLHLPRVDPVGDGRPEVDGSLTPDLMEHVLPLFLWLDLDRQTAKIQRTALHRGRYRRRDDEILAAARE